MRTEDPTTGASDYALLRSGAAIADLTAWTSLRVTGPDTRPFLQGLATQDLAAAHTPGFTQQTLFLSERGRPVALAWVSLDPRDESALLIADEGAREALPAHFERFRVMEDVTFAGPRDVWIFGFSGPGKRDLMRRFATASGADGLEVLDSDPLSFVLLPSLAAVPPGFDLVAPEAFEAWRLAIGLPRTGLDLDPDRIATELSLTDSISQTKGCFVGQEVVARTSNRGQVKRSRVGFRFEAKGGPLSPKAEIRTAGTTAGYVTSSALEPGTGRGLGMGYLTLEAQVDGSPLTVDRSGDAVPIQLAAWPI